MFKTLISLESKTEAYSPPVELKIFFSCIFQKYHPYGGNSVKAALSSLRTTVAKPLHENSATDPASFYFTIHFFSAFERFLQGYVQAVTLLGSPTTSKMSVQVLGSPYSKILPTSLKGCSLWKEYCNYLKTRKSQDHGIHLLVEFKSDIHRDHQKSIYLEYPNATLCQYHIIHFDL